MPVQNNKKTNRSGRRNFGSTTPNQIYATSFPREMKVKLPYLEIQNFTASAGVANDRVYNLNSIFDPYQTGTGHQPQGYDQWANFYNRYRVDSAHVMVSFPNADSVYGTVITILGNNSGTAINDPSVAAESPISLTKAHSGSGPTTVLSRNFNLADLNGVTREVYRTDDRYQAQFGSNPTEGLYLHIVTTDLNLAPTTVSYIVQIKFDVTLFDPVQLPLS